MSVQPVPTIRAAHLSPYIEFLQNKGFPIERALEGSNLPTTVADHPESHIPLMSSLQFLSILQKSQGLREIGFLSGNLICLELLARSTLQMLLSAPTLNAALNTFFRYIGEESSVLEGWTSGEGETVSVCINHRISVDDEEMRAMHIHFMLLMLALIRVFAGPGWKPHVVGLQCRLPLSPLVGHYFPNTKFVCGQSHSWIGFPAEMLGSEKLWGNCHRLRRPVLQTTAIASEQSQSDFAGSLKRVLKSYLSDGYPSIELAATISGTSIRTLQRNLSQCGLTYSKIVDCARVEAAMVLLRDPNIKIIEIAYAVGYEDPSHFSRAFRRMAGTSPREYRLRSAA